MKSSVASLLKDISENFDEINTKFLSRTEKSENFYYTQIDELENNLTDFQEKVEYLNCNHMNNYQRLKERLEFSQKEEKYLKFWQITTFALAGLVIGMLVR